MAGELYQENFLMARWEFLPFITAIVTRIVVNLYIIFILAAQTHSVATSMFIAVLYESRSCL